MKFSHLFALSTLGTFAIAQDELVDIPTTAANAGSFATLLAAIQAAGLGETLSGEGPFTVFAPTDAAFTDIDQALVACLLAQPEALTAVLTYHVLPASVKSSAITGAMEATTVNGEPLMIDVVNGTGVVLNGDVTVITADILATNGVIHVIDDGTYQLRFRLSDGEKVVSCLIGILTSLLDVFAWLQFLFLRISTLQHFLPAVPPSPSLQRSHLLAHTPFLRRCSCQWPPLSLSLLLSRCNYKCTLKAVDVVLFHPSQYQ